MRIDDDDGEIWMMILYRIPFDNNLTSNGIFPKRAILRSPDITVSVYGSLIGAVD